MNKNLGVARSTCEAGKPLGHRLLNYLKSSPLKRIASLTLISGALLPNVVFAAIAYVQGSALTPAPSETSVAITYPASQTQGDLNVVVVSWGSSTTQLTSVTDTLGNTYTQAVGPTISSGNATQSIYYAKNIAAAVANSNTVTVTFNALAPNVDIRIAEYSGIDGGAPLDVAVGAIGTSVTTSSGALTTTNASDLLVGANYVANVTTGPGSGYTQRLLTQAGSILEDQVVRATNTYTATAPQNASGWYVMQLAAFKAAATGGDTTPPTSPSNLAASAASSTQINLSWTASTDAGGISGYRVERCVGAGCSNFAQIATTSVTNFSDTKLSPSTSYTYRVRATDTAGNFGGYNATSQTATTQAGSASIAFVQGEAMTPSSSVTSMTMTYHAAQTAGNLNVVIVSWGDSTSQVSSITDTQGNAYLRAVGPTVSSGSGTQSIYYAKNIAAAGANGNAVTVTFNTAVARADIRIAEYRGADTNSPLDGAVGGTGTSATATSPSLTTINANDLLVAGDSAGNSTTGAGSGYTARLMTHNSTILEEMIVTTTNTYSATAPLSASGWWVMSLAAFKAASTDTQAPTAPSGLSAMAASSSQINLSWTASTDNVGVTGYKVERCQGVGCSTFTQIATPTTASFSDTGLSASTSYSYRVRATDAAGNLSTYSNTSTATTQAAGDTTPPSAPSNLTAAAASSAQINLSWTASTDNVGVTGYKVERCQGAGCSTFAQIGTTTGVTSYSDTGLSASTSYSYRVRATDAASNLSAYSNTASATTSTGSSSIAFVQGNYATPAATQSTIAATFNSAQAAGDLNVVIIAWNNTTATLNSLVDSKGNTYVRAVGPTTSAGNETQYIYYAKNIVAAAAGANAVTATFSAAVPYPDIRIAEYSGIDTVNPLDGSVGASGSSATMSSGLLTTTNANDLLVAGNELATTTTAADANFTQRMLTTDGSILEDRIVSSTGSYSAGATQSSAGWWVMDLVAFKGASSGGDTQAPTAPTNLTATSASSSQINLSWTASTDNVGVTGYKVERCQGAGCSTFTQVATPTGTTFSDTGLTASTSYSYRVRANDAAGNLSTYSNTSTATTSASDTQAPTAPASLSATAASSSQINLSWTASTDNVGVTGYKVERCQGAGCSTFTQVATPTGTTFNDTGLTASTSYSYRVRATDAAGNLSTYSNTASATTSAPLAAPTALTVTASSNKETDISWTASTSPGVTGYLIERCQGTSCSSFAQIGTATCGTYYYDSALTANTSYSYRIRATDGSNTSPYSSTLTVSTLTTVSCD